MNNAMNNPGVWPSVLYDDADAARRFLIDVFGFTEALVVRGDDSGSIVHGELRWPEGGGVMFGSRGQSHGGVAEPSARTQWIYVVTADPDAVYRRALDAGATISDKPRDTDYGSRNVGIVDPEGTNWIFGTYPGAA
ncbi:VOC family protein [Prauserella cavernicola]|uniref:VOC family protein n=1 Tax=Prauserella cavernicola TaxID=2800127 RepID=A0A934QWS9_9PSEU|nr:VOC family protein [Prauserella cavernicola]MBK1786734.1 VOC family protein [Prauserella cavernicola]